MRLIVSQARGCDRRQTPASNGGRSQFKSPRADLHGVETCMTPSIVLFALGHGRRDGQATKSVLTWLWARWFGPTISTIDRYCKVSTTAQSSCTITPTVLLRNASSSRRNL